MPQNVHLILQALFASPGRPGQSVNLKWRLVCRKGRPFLLLPPGAANARTGLRLYSGHRRRAKIWRALLPAMLQMPSAKFFQPVSFQADAASEMMQFLTQLSGTAAGEIYPLTIKLSEVHQRSRLVLLLCDESGRPTRVIKAGLNAEGMTATSHEAEFLEKLPPHTLGCIRMTGRLTTPTMSAFATDFFPGASPDNDAGMEHLFHAWLNPAPLVRLDNLPIWCELAAKVANADAENWRVLEKTLSGKNVRTTLYHGDFAPWNIRVVNSKNLQVFDWERGSLEGIPGWDWFHFIIQTSVLAKRYSPERAAAEVEQVIRSARFKKYAEAAGISDIVQPLILAYLLHQRWVIKPLAGAKITARLFDFLSAHWLLKPEPVPVAMPKPAAPGLLAAVKTQLQFAASQWANLFWEPSLNSSVQPSWLAQFKAHWPIALIAAAFMISLAGVQFLSDLHLMFLPFYMAISAWVTWKIDRRWGAQIASAAALLGPMAMAVKESGERDIQVMIWNVVMRFVMLQTCVLFVDRIHARKDFFHQQAAADDRSARLAETWAVVMASIFSLVAIATFDYVLNPQMTVLPLYIFPCMMLTLVLNLRWGVAAILIANFTGSLVEYLTNPSHHYKLLEVFGWNFIMRLAVSLLVIVLLNRIRKENLLFFAPRSKAAETEADQTAPNPKPVRNVE